jgi:hypothetical protein
MRISEKARQECAENGWEDEDVFLFLNDLTPEDFYRRETARYGAYDAIWVFTPAIQEPEGWLWIRLARQESTVFVVVSFHPENADFKEEQ